MRSSIAILGAGAVGGYYGGRLARHGLGVHFLLRSDYDHVRTRGLQVRSIDGDFSLSPRDIRVYNDPATMPKVDLVIVTLKSTLDSTALLCTDRAVPTPRLGSR